MIVDDEGRAKVTDFGIARAGASDMTQTGSIMGTAQYLSPEQAQGHAVSAPSDLYSIGIVLYELLTGRVPFDGESAVTIALKQVSEAPVPPSALNPAVPPELEARRAARAGEGPGARASPTPTRSSPRSRTRAARRPRRPRSPARAPAAYDPRRPRPTPVPRRRRHRASPTATARAGGCGCSAVLLVVAAHRRRAAARCTRHQKVAVPDVVGADQAAAETTLRAATASTSTRVHETSDAGRKGERASARTRRAATKADKGSTVTLTVSGGPGDGAGADVDGPDAAATRRKTLQRRGLQGRRATRDRPTRSPRAA